MLWNPSLRPPLAWTCGGKRFRSGVHWREHVKGNVSGQVYWLGHVEGNISGQGFIDVDMWRETFQVRGSLAWTCGGKHFRSGVHWREHVKGNVSGPVYWLGHVEGNILGQGFIDVDMWRETFQVRGWLTWTCGGKCFRSGDHWHRHVKCFGKSGLKRGRGMVFYHGSLWSGYHPVCMSHSLKRKFWLALPVLISGYVAFMNNEVLASLYIFIFWCVNTD